MARVKLELPSRFDYTTDIQVCINNINYGGHLGNDSLLSLIHEARIRFLKHHGFTESNIGSLGIIMVDTVIIYKSESFHGDLLTFEVGVGDMSKVGCDFYFRVKNKHTGKEVAHAKTGIVFFDYDARKVMNVPEEFKKLFVVR
jgi:acyl-CoA thioester hydrolase